MVSDHRTTPLTGRFDPTGPEGDVYVAAGVSRHGNKAS